MEHFTQSDFWEDRYKNNHTPWDIGYVSTPIKEYVDQISDKNIRILIPGAGYAHEAIYLHQQGFKNVLVCDWAESSFSHLREACPHFPAEHQIVGDFFELDQQVDLILEQTFFCAISPKQRMDYARQSANLLVTGGKLAGVLFAEHLGMQGPPFGGTAEEYEKYFAPFFEIKTMEISKNSIKPRLGRELFIELLRQ
ncbi:MAG: SAM-dependent methyltransferase [Bacteroidetes bacterium]|nr:MAG: SAM-dependent methyltransferase [Bacteroidota bacterium]